MNNKVNSVLNSIEKIDHLVMEADVSVSDAMNDVYNKQFKMEGNVTEDYINHEYYQESVIAGILIGGGIIAVLATAIVLITKHVKKSASGDPEKKDDKSTAAGIALDKPEDVKKRLEDVSKDLEKLGGKVTIPSGGINIEEIKNLFKQYTTFFETAENVNDEANEEAIDTIATQLDGILDKITGSDYKQNGNVEVNTDTINELASLSVVVADMTKKSTETATKLQKRAEEAKKKADSETDKDKKQKSEALNKKLSEISKKATNAGKVSSEALSGYRGMIDQIIKSIKETTEKSAEQSSGETKQRTESDALLKQKIKPITDNWVMSSSNMDSNNPSVKLTEEEAYAIIRDIHTDVVNDRYPKALDTLKNKANEDPTKARLIKNLVEATIGNSNVFDIDEDMINIIKTGLSELDNIATSAPVEEPESKKDETETKSEETKPESEETKEPESNSGESAEKITISKDNASLYDIITSWNDKDYFEKVVNSGGVIKGPINKAYKEELSLYRNNNVSNSATKFEITFGSDAEKQFVQSFLSMIDNFLNDTETFEKISPELRKKLMAAINMFLKRNENIITANITLDANNFEWVDIRRKFRELQEKYNESDETPESSDVNEKIKAIVTEECSGKGYMLDHTNEMYNQLEYITTEPNGAEYIIKKLVLETLPDSKNNDLSNDEIIRRCNTVITYIDCVKRLNREVLNGRIDETRINQWYEAIKRKINNINNSSENTEEKVPETSEKDQKMQVAFEQLETRINQAQQKYPNGFATIEIATGCDPRTFGGIVLTQFIENKSEQEIKNFSKNLMDCLVGGFFREASQTHAKAKSQLPNQCKEAIDAMQTMINDGYEIGNTLAGTNYTPDNLSKYKGYTFKGNHINTLMKVKPENILSSEIWNDVKLGNSENTEEPASEETNTDNVTSEENNTEEPVKVEDTLRYILQNPSDAVTKANSLSEESDPLIDDKLKNALIEINDKNLWDFVLYDLKQMGHEINLDAPITRKDTRVIASTALRINMIDESRNDLNGYLKHQYIKNPQDNVKQAIFDEVKRYADIKGIDDNLIGPSDNFIPIDRDKILSDFDRWKDNNRLTSAAAEFAEKQKYAKDFVQPQNAEPETENQDYIKSNTEENFETPSSAESIESILNNRINDANSEKAIEKQAANDKDNKQQAELIQNKLNGLNIGNDTEETVSLEDIKNLPSLMSDAVSGKLSDEGAKNLAANIMQLKLAIVWPTDIVEANNVDYAISTTKKILSDCESVASSGDQNAVEQMKSDIVAAQNNPNTEITSTPEEALKKIVDLTGKVSNLIKTKAINAANNANTALNATKEFVNNVVIPGMNTAVSLGSTAATTTVEKAKELIKTIDDGLKGIISTSPVSDDNDQKATDNTQQENASHIKYDSNILFMPGIPNNIFNGIPDLGSMDTTQALSELYNTFDYINKPTGSKYYRNHEDTDFSQGDLDFLNTIKGQGGGLPLRKKSDLASNTRILSDYFRAMYAMLKTIDGNNAMNRYNPTSKKLVVNIAETLQKYLGYIQSELEIDHKNVLEAATPMMNAVLDECQRIINGNQA